MHAFVCVHGCMHDLLHMHVKGMNTSSGHCPTVLSCTSSSLHHLNLLLLSAEEAKKLCLGSGVNLYRFGLVSSGSDLNMGY